MSTPLVSVCIPAYEQPALLERAIESVFAQTYPAIEVIVTDDSNTDSVERMIDAWRAHPRLSYERNQVGLGSPANWNAAMMRSKGEYVKILHHDDWLSTPGAIATLVGALEDSPEANFAFSSALACDGNGEPVYLHRPTDLQLAELREQPWVLQFGNFIGPPSSTIFRRKEGFRFHEGWRWVVDVDAYIRLLGDQPNFVFIPEPLVSVSTQGAHQVTRTFEQDVLSRVCEHLELYAHHRPVGISGRFRGLKFLSSTLAGCDRNQLRQVRDVRSKQAQTPEERVLFLVLQGKKWYQGH